MRSFRGQLFQAEETVEARPRVRTNLEVSGKEKRKQTGRK